MKSDKSVFVGSRAVEESSKARGAGMTSDAPMAPQDRLYENVADETRCDTNKGRNVHVVVVAASASSPPSHASFEHFFHA